MNADAKSREALRRVTGEAARGYGQILDEVRQRGAGAPRPGDLFLCRATAELPVEWLVLERRGEDPGMLWVLPADTNSLLGSGDVAVPSTAARGALTLRCRFGGWRAASVFEPGLRTGILEPEIVDQARRLRDAVKQGERVGSVDQREMDLETEYVDWVHEVLEEAQAAIEASTVAEIPQDAAPEADAAEVVEFPARGRWSSAEKFLGIAASVLLVMSLGLGRQVVHTGQEHRTTAEVLGQRIAQLGREEESAVSSHRESLEELAKRQAEAEQRHQRELAELERQQRARPLVNVPFVVLSSTRTRSATEAVELPSRASHLVIILQLESGAEFPSYRLEIRRDGSSRRVWSSDALKTDGAELTVALPRELLPAGDYQLRLSGRRSGESELVAEYTLEVEVQ